MTQVSSRTCKIDLTCHCTIGGQRDSRSTKDAAAMAGMPYGNRQSTGAAPCPASRSFARLKGREPKNPRSADIGDG